MLPLDLKAARTLVRRVRRVTLVLVVAALGYLFVRFDLVRLPEEGCSPLYAVPPGSLLVVDLRPRPLASGDIVLYRDGDGVLLLGRVDEPPVAGTPPGSLWVATDATGCPTRDSNTMGALSREAVAGRVMYVQR